MHVRKALKTRCLSYADCAVLVGVGKRTGSYIPAEAGDHMGGVIAIKASVRSRVIREPNFSKTWWKQVEWDVVPVASFWHVSDSI